MVLNDFNKTDWNRGNLVRLSNGKEYFVKGVKGHGRYLLMYSEEFDAYFVADHRIVDCRTSDYVEPAEVYLEHKRLKHEAALARQEAYRQEQIRLKAERRERNLREQERIHLEAVARKAAKKVAKEAVTEPVAVKTSEELVQRSMSVSVSVCGRWKRLSCPSNNLL